MSKPENAKGPDQAADAKPPARARGFSTLLIGFVLSLLVSKGFEVVANTDAITQSAESAARVVVTELLEMQASWKSAVESSTPLALASTYWEDLWFIYDYGPAATVPIGERSLDELGWPRSWLAEHYQSPQGNKELYQIILTPFLALARTFLQLTDKGGWSFLWIGLQLALGVPAFMLAFAHLESTPTQTRYFPEHLVAKIIVIPVGVVAASSVLALGLKYLMFGALAALGWFTSLSGLCCAAASAAGFCWWCSLKFAEYHVSGAVQRKLLD